LADDDLIREQIHRHAQAHAEATVYSLNNPYLTTTQKWKVEAVFQFPIAVFAYAFAVFALAQGQSIWMAYVSATIVSAGAWALARFLPGKFFYPLSIGFAGGGYTVVCLVLAALAAFQQRWGVAAFMGLSAFAITSFVAAPMWLWTITAGRLHPKYGIAKRLFGVTFPFEAELD
jgi:hypothetical protein